MKCTFLATGRARRAMFSVVIVGAVPIVARSAPAQNPVNLPPIVSTAEGTQQEIRGMIIARRGDEMFVRVPDGIYVVKLTDSTGVVAPAGFMKSAKKHYDASVLIPGLGVTVEGLGAGDGRLVASRVKFAKEALKVAQQIEAGGEVVRADVNMLKVRADSTDATVARNDKATRDSITAINRRAIDSARAVSERITSLDEYGVKVSGTVTFQTGSFKLSSDAKRTLDQLVSNATGLTGYMIQVTGYADAIGPDPMNQRLSDARAEAVVEYLVQEKHIPPRRILNPTGVGESHAIGSNKTASGRAMNRRAEVQVLVNTGISGGPGSKEP